MKIKTAELSGADLDLAVALAAKVEIVYEKGNVNVYLKATPEKVFRPRAIWSQGGPIIEREIAKIERFSDALWEATAFTRNAQDFVQNGPTPLIAAMRCYVASKLGDEVEIPDELKGA